MAYSWLAYLIILTFMFKKKTDYRLIIAILVAAVMISGALVFAGIYGRMSDKDFQAKVIDGINQYVEDMQKEAQGGGNPTPEVIDQDMTDNDAILGDLDAPVTIVEFSDFQCPYCGVFYSDAYQQIKANYVDTGKVKFVFRDFPLSGHPGAYPAALAAECVREQGGDDMYYKMHNKLFENQEALQSEPTVRAGILAGYAEELGVDVDTYNECVNNETYKDEIYADQNDATGVGISGTPTFIINGKVLIGAEPYGEFSKVIEEALAE